jgi:hypothetical protein
MANSKLSAQSKRHLASANHIEASSSEVGNLPSAFLKDIQQNIKSAPNDIFDQLLGIGNYESKNSSVPHSGEMKMGEPIDLSSHKAKESTPRLERKNAAPAMDYHKEISRQSERSTNKESSEIKQQIQQIQAELARLISSADSIVSAAYGDIQMNHTPAKVGKYHVNFLAWMLTVVQDARRKVEESGAWLATAKGKGGKRGHVITDAWKKGNTSVTMSNERSAVTQTG